MSMLMSSLISFFIEVLQSELIETDTWTNKLKFSEYIACDKVPCYVTSREIYLEEF